MSVKYNTSGDLLHFTVDPDVYAKLIDVDHLLLDQEWPLAVDPKYIIYTEDQKIERASRILRVYIQESLHGKCFLDWGNDEYVIAETSKIAKHVCGYRHDLDEKFDIILLYDVIDHLKDEEQIDNVISEIIRLSHQGTTIHLRCHPWTSRHATHGYYELNKAFAHFFTKLGKDTIKIIRPIEYYKKLFNRFSMIEYKQHIYSLEPFFLAQPFVDIFETILDGDAEWQKYYLSVQFIDYKLRIC